MGTLLFHLKGKFSNFQEINVCGTQHHGIANLSTYSLSINLFLADSLGKRLKHHSINYVNASIVWER